MSETKERKTVRKGIVIALGIICIVLAASLIGAFAINTKSSQNSQDDVQSWTEGYFYFNVTSDQNINFTIPTAGFSSVTITIDAVSATMSVGLGFQVFIGFMTANTTVDYQVYDAQSYPEWVPYPLLPLGYMFPPWSYFMGYSNWPASFKQTYEITFSKIMVWIWNNSTLFSPSEPIWGNVYYYLTT